MIIRIHLRNDIFCSGSLECGTLLQWEKPTTILGGLAGVIPPGKFLNLNRSILMHSESTYTGSQVLGFLLIIYTEIFSPKVCS